MALFAWISRQDAQSALIGAGIIAASLAADIALFRQPVVSRPLRWFGRVVVADPLTRVMHRALDEWAAKVWEPRIQGIEEKVDEVTSLSRKLVIEARDGSLRPRIEIVDPHTRHVRKQENGIEGRYLLPNGCNITVQDGEQVDPALALPRYVRDKVAQTTAERAAAQA